MSANCLQGVCVWRMSGMCLVMSVPTFYVCPHLLCLSPHIMSVPTYHVCPNLLCLSPPIMSVPTYYICPHLSCLSPPIMSVPTYYVCPHQLFCVSLAPPIILCYNAIFALVQIATSPWDLHFLGAKFCLDPNFF